MSIKEYMFRKGAARKIPVSGTFELTSRCNLDCKMCYVRMSPDEQSAIGKELSTEEWIALGRDAVKEGMVYLLLTGGEPLLRKDFIQLYTTLIQMGLLITVNTNGTLITPEIIECFKQYKPEKVNITLYGMSDCTYGNLCGVSTGFRKAIRGILMLKEAGIRVNISTTFTKYNIGDMDEIVAFGKSENIPVRMSSYIFPPVRNQHEVDDMNMSPEEMGIASAYFDMITLENEKIEKRKNYIQQCLEKNVPDAPVSRPSACMAGRGAFWISWDGKMYPCGMLPDYAYSVKEYSFHDAWMKTVSDIKTIMLPAECSVCKYQPLCPACPAVSQSSNKATDVVVLDMCERTKAYVKKFLKE